MSLAKPANKLTPKDWEKYPVWTLRFGQRGQPGQDETWMVPVKESFPPTDDYEWWVPGEGWNTQSFAPRDQFGTLVLCVRLNPEQTLLKLYGFNIAVKPMTKAEAC